MMNRIDDVFNRLQDKNKNAFIAYITAGDPSLKKTETLVAALEKGGANIVELGVPFSDPMADGLTNQKAAERALRKGATLKGILGAVEKIRQKSRIPIVLFTYLNPVFRYGMKKFVRDAKQAGIDGVLPLDLPIEESGEFSGLLNSKGMKMINLIAPTSDKKRIKLICQNSSGFIYYVSRTGVTGARDSVEKNVGNMVKKIKKHTDLPVVVGFGISKPDHVKKISKYADGIVVGSAIVRKIEKNIGNPGMERKVSKFVRTLTREL